MAWAENMMVRVFLLRGFDHPAFGLVEAGCSGVESAFYCPSRDKGAAPAVERVVNGLRWRAYRCKTRPYGFPTISDTKDVTMQRAGVTNAKCKPAFGPR